MSINLSPDDPCVMNEAPRVDYSGNIKVTEVPIDELPEDERRKLMDLPPLPGPRRIAATNWFRKW